MHLSLVLLAGYSSAQTTTVSVPPGEVYLVPFDSQMQGTTIYSGRQAITSNTLHTVTGDMLTPYYSTDHSYPGVVTWASKPFLVDNTGLNAYTTTEYAGIVSDPATVLDFTFENGVHKYLSTHKLGIDIVTRSYSNLDQPAYTTYYISPLTGITNDYHVNYFDKHSNNADGEEQIANQNVVEYATGVILADRDVGLDPWKLTWHNGDNELTKAKITFALEDWTDPNYKTRLNTDYSNSYVSVKPTIQFDALDNFISLDYHVINENNLFHIYSSTTDMAVIDVDIVNSYNLAGEVPTYTTPLDFQQSQSVSLTGATVDPQATVDTDKNDQTATFASQITYNAYFKYLTDSYPLQFQDKDIVTPQSISDNAPSLASIDLNSFSTLPNSITASYVVSFRPYTEFHEAVFTYQAYGVEWSGNWAGHEGVHEDVVVDINQQFQFPYRVKLINVYHIARIVFTVVIYSENIVEYVPVEGSPVRVENIVDYGISQVGVLNPNRDSFTTSFSYTSYNPITSSLDALADWWNDVANFWGEIDVGIVITIIVLVVMAIIGIAVISVASRFRRR